MITMKFDKKIKSVYEYYYELISVLSQRKTSILNDKKFYLRSTYSSVTKGTILFGFLFLIQSIIIFSSNISWFILIIPYLIVILPLVTNLFLIVPVIIMVLKSKRQKDKRIVYIDDKKITTTTEKKEKKETLKKEDIFALAIGNYSLILIPKDLKATPIGFPIEYEKDLLDALEKENIQIDIIRASDKPLNTNVEKDNRKEIINHPNLVVFLSITLFILSILSIFIGIIMELILDNFVYANTLVCNDWVYLCCIIIPIISIIFGLYFKNKKVKNNTLNAKLNIVGGIIVVIILFLMGEHYVIPEDSSKTFKHYEKYLGMRIPTKSIRLQEATYGFVEGDYSWGYNLIVANFTKRDGTKFANEIKSSDKWIISNNVDAEYVETLPLELEINDHTYIYKYDRTNDTENVFNKEKGTNYIFTYDVVSNHFEIHEYTLSQKRK